MCSECGQFQPIPYEEFRTGLTYPEVFRMLWIDSDDPADWKYKRRHTVLGFWRMLKRDMYETYVQGWRSHHNEDGTEKVSYLTTRDDEVPF